MPIPTPIKKPTSGTFVICLLLSLALIFFLVLPKYHDYSVSKQTHQQAADSLTTIQGQQTELQKLYVDVGDNKADLDKIDQAIPTKPDIAGVYALMEGFGRAANLSLTSIQATDEADIPSNEATPETTPISPTLGVVDVDMQLSGSFEGFNQMLGAIEQSLRLVDVQSIDLSQDKDATALTFRATFKTYYQR